MRELRLGDEDAADRHAIAAADQFARLVPHLERMRVAGVERLRIGVHDARRDPGEMPAALRGCPAQALITPSKSRSKVTL